MGFVRILILLLVSCVVGHRHLDFRSSLDSLTGSTGRGTPLTPELNLNSVNFGQRKPQQLPDDSLDEDVCLAMDHGKAVHWSNTCHGTWSAWSWCSEQCFRTRMFTLTENVRCPDIAFKTGEIEYSLCQSGSCALTQEALESYAIGKEFREAVFEFGLASKRVEAIGHVVSTGSFYFQTGAILTLCIVCFLQSLKLEWLPDICVVIPVAAALALFLRYHTFHGVNFGMAFNSFLGTVVSRIMNDFLIPISIFEGAYHVQRLNFYSQFFYGLVFACIGTGFSAALIAAMVKYSGNMGFHPVNGWRESIAYAAFIADVDPVATLAIFGNLKADALLSTMVAGEATLNDPIAIVIFNICNERKATMEFSYVEEVKNGIVLLVGSIALGFVVGLVFSYLIKPLRVRGRGPLEAAYVFLGAYGGYAIGEYLGYSGIIVTLFSGLMMGVYSSRILENTETVDKFLNSAARTADLMMFIIIGFSTFVIDDFEGIKLGLLTILFCLVARAIMIGVLVPVVNLVKISYNSTPLNFGTAFMMWHSGLRGGMTVMMALMIDPFWSPNQDTLLNATLISVIGLSYLCGTTGPLFLRYFGVPMNVPQEDGSLYVSNPTSVLHRAHELLSLIMGCEVEEADDKAPEEHDAEEAVS